MKRDDVAQQQWNTNESEDDELQDTGTSPVKTGYEMDVYRITG